MEENKAKNNDPAIEELKELYKKEMQKFFIRGLVAGQKTIAGVIADILSKDDANVNKISKTVQICEKTLGITVEDFAEKVSTIEEMMEVANREDDSPKTNAEEIEETENKNE